MMPRTFRRHIDLQVDDRQADHPSCRKKNERCIRCTGHAYIRGQRNQLLNGMEQGSRGSPLRPGACSNLSVATLASAGDIAAVRKAPATNAPAAQAVQRTAFCGRHSCCCSLPLAVQICCLMHLLRVVADVQSTCPDRETRATLLLHAQACKKHRNCCPCRQCIVPADAKGRIRTGTLLYKVH